MNPDSYFTRKEAAAYLRISLRSLDSLLARRALPVTRLGGRTLIRRAALDATLAKLETPAVS